MSSEDEYRKAPDAAVAAKTAGGNSAFHNFHNDFIHISKTYFNKLLCIHCDD